MRVFVSVTALYLAVATAHAVPLSLVSVDESAVNRAFDSDGKITPQDFTEHFTLLHTTGSAFLQSRRLPRGEKGTPGEGLFAYLYRLDLSQLKGSSDAPCIDGFSIDFGPVEPLDYQGNKRRDQVFIIADGGPGTLPPQSAEQVGDTILFRFNPALCASRIGSIGGSTFFFGLASKQPAAVVLVQVRDTQQMHTPLKTEAPKLPIHVDCDAAGSLPEVFPSVPGGTLRITGKCKGTILIPKDIPGAALVGVGQTDISGAGKPGAVITMDGSKDAVIKNVAVRDGQDGILLRSGASATLLSVRAVENDHAGFQVTEASEVQCIDCLASRNGGDGFSILRGALMNFLGHTVSARNNQNGIKILEATAVFGAMHKKSPTLFATSRQLRATQGRCSDLEEQLSFVSGPDPDNPGLNFFYGCSAQVKLNEQEGAVDDGGVLYIGPGCKVDVRENVVAGISLVDVARAHIYEARVIVRKTNPGTGFAIADSSTLCSDGSTLRALKNESDGIRVDGDSAVYVDSKGTSPLDSAICSKQNGQVGLAIFASTVSCAGSLPLVLNPNDLGDATGLSGASGCVVAPMTETGCLTATPGVVR